LSSGKKVRHNFLNQITNKKNIRKDNKIRQ